MLKLCSWNLNKQNYYNKFKNINKKMDCTPTYHELNLNLFSQIS